MTKNIKFTDEALKQIEKIILENKPEKYFRITVQGGGCSGLNIIFLLTKKLERMTLFLIKQLLTSFTRYY